MTRSWICLGAGVAAALAFLVGVALPQSASAGAFKCEDRVFDAIDEMRLRHARHGHLLE
jgi:hypothetical protein